MKVVNVRIRGLSPYTQSRSHETPKLNKELPDAYEQRVWREKAHINADGHLVIPALAPKNAIADAARYLSEKVPGKGQSTYTKHFEAGVMCLEDSVVCLGDELKPITKDDLVGDRLFVSANGKRGSGTRVHRIFPTVLPGWEAAISFVIVDEIITEDVFARVLRQAGQLIGIGSFRPRNNGIRGRFAVEEIEWRETDEI